MLFEQVQSPAFNAEAAARGAMVKIGPLKRLFIIALELALFPLVRGLGILGYLRRAKAVQEIRRILVVEYWNLGDIVILLPFLKNLRFHYPKARITLLINPSTVLLLEEQDWVDELVLVRVPWAQHHARWKKYNPLSPLWIHLVRTLLALREKHFDLALTGRMDIRDNFIVWVVGARQRVGYGVGGGSFFLTGVVEPDLRHPHRSRVWLRLLEHLEKPLIDTRPQIILSPSEQEFAKRFLAERGIQEHDVLVGIHPGARIRTRQWGEENFAAVGARLSSESPVKILWFLDPSLKGQPTVSLERHIPVSLPFRRFMAVLARCHLLVCNDSGPMHVASALGVPVVAVFGPTAPAWFGPLGDKNRVVIRPEFWCRPCFDYCIFDQPYCLRTISTDDVFRAALSALRDLPTEAAEWEGTAR